MKPLFVYSSLIFMFSCSHWSYVEEEKLTAGSRVAVLTESHSRCEFIQDVYGNIRNSEIKIAVQNAFNMARNQAATLDANALVYQETTYKRALLKHAISVRFASYLCPDSVVKQELAHAKSQSLSAGESQKQWVESRANQAAANMAAQAAMHQAMSASMDAANAASAAASNASIMHHHH